MVEPSVAAIILGAMPHTLALTALGLGWSVALGIVLGCFSATHRGSWLDRAIGVVSVSAIAVPSFVVALYSLLVFAVAPRWLPAIGAGEAGDLGDQLRHLVLPAFAIGLGWVGYIARLVRASMLEVMGENYIRTARAFGLPERRIVYRYALTVAILPTVALLGVGIGNLLSGAVFAEIVFARPGIGKLIYDSVLNRNYPVVMGAVLVTTMLYVLATLIADLLAALSPIPVSAPTSEPPPFAAVAPPEESAFADALRRVLRDPLGAWCVAGRPVRAERRAGADDRALRSQCSRRPGALARPVVRPSARYRQPRPRRARACCTAGASRSAWR